MDSLLPATSHLAYRSSLSTTTSAFGMKVLVQMGRPRHLKIYNADDQNSSSGHIDQQHRRRLGCTGRYTSILIASVFRVVIRQVPQEAGAYTTPCACHGIVRAIVYSNRSP